MRYAGIDWSENNQDYAVVDQDGVRVKLGKFKETPDGLRDFDAEMRKHADPDTGALPTVAIETDKGLTVTTLKQLGYAVYAINPMKVARYRERYSTGRNKNDRADATLIANVVRTDPDVHLPMPSISDAALALNVMCRGHQDAVQDTLRALAVLRSHLRLYWPAFAAEFTPSRLMRSPEWLTVLDWAPTPTAARAMTAKRLALLLRQAGRSRYIDRDVAKYMPFFKTDVLHHPADVEAAYGEVTRSLVGTARTLLVKRDTLEVQLVAAVREHPMYPIFESCPSLGDVTAARLLGEIGDDLTRFASPRGLKAYAGTAPTHRQSGKSEIVVRRQVKNNRLNTSMFMWALVAIRRGGGARVMYDRRRSAGDYHAAALRNLGNRLLGCLWHCMRNGELWDEQTVWAHYQLTAIQAEVDTTIPEGGDENDTSAEAAALVAPDTIPDESLDAATGTDGPTDVTPRTADHGRR
ncbi:IS110 family transposase [Knoellia subterranea]|uniref:Transposase n=1 Tax=Knoellia subterranea KCTC 19937 TaxID=1385521 RepID=A0A0A0JPA5_9MICO|nr:IS110 family transposase [Knoellia subterranea]KGN39275.1 transposase [Knoellia subterranea KCTC 19937]